MTAETTQEKLQLILDRYVSDALEAWENHKASVPGPFHEGFPAGHAEVLRTFETKTKDALARNSLRFFEPAVDALLEQHEIALEKDSSEYRRFALEVMSEVLPKQEPGAIFPFYFKAVAEEDTPAKAFLANAVLRNVFSDPQRGETSLGFEFVAEGRLNKQKRLVWTPLATNELPDLSPFIFKWNLLDFYREKRVD